jgi:hypothetical protein
MLDIVTLPNGTLESLKVNGKAVQKSFLNAYNKAVTKSGIFKSFPVENNYSASNPFSGAEVELNGFEYSIFRFCINWYAGYQRGNMAVPVQTYDNMRYLFLSLNSSAYYDLLD